MSKRMGLGRGLEAFFGNVGEETKETVSNKEIKEEKPVKKPEKADKTSKVKASDKAEKAKKEKTPAKKEKTVKKEKATAAPKRDSRTIGLMEDGTPQKVSLALIDANSDQPRKKFNEEELAELAASIRTYGVLQPLIVAKKDERYEIIAGERRYRASKLAGLREVPVIIRDFSRQQMMEVSLIENIQRSNLNAIEEAKAYHLLITDFGLTQEEISTRVSKSRVAVTNSMRLLKLDEKVQNMLVDGKLTAGHARALLGIADKEKQLALAEKIVSRELSVRETEQLVRKLTQPEPEKKKESAEKEDGKLALFYHDLEDRLKEVMGTKVQIKRKEQGHGKIEIEYYSADELERISELLQSLRS